MAQAVLENVERQRNADGQQQQLQRIERDMVRQSSRRQIPPPSLPAASAPIGPSFLVDEIALENDDWSGAAQLPVLARYRNTRMGPAEMYALARALTEYYSGLGYVTTLVTVPLQNVRAGKLVLRVEWGYVAGVLLDGQAPQGWREQAMLASAMPGLAGRLLNVRDVDQLVENLSTPGKTAIVSIRAAERTGYSYLDVHFAKDNPFPLSLRVDNSNHYEDDARARLGAQFGMGDLLGINDTLDMQVGRGHYATPADNRQHNWAVNYHLPFGFWQISTSVANYHYGRALYGPAGRYDSEANIRDERLRLGRVLGRNRASRGDAWVELARQGTRQYLEGRQVDVSSKRYSSIELGVSAVDAFGSGVMYGELALVHGLAAFGGEPGSTDPDAPTARYNKLKTAVQWQQDLASPSVRFVTRMAGQYTGQQLLNTARMQLGDEYSVRGFEGTPLQGDRGVLWSNTVSVPQPCPLLTPIFLTCTVSAGVDAGLARNRVSASTWARPQRIFGAALGGRLDGRHAELALTAGWPVRTLPGLQRKPVVYLAARSRW